MFSIRQPGGARDGPGEVPGQDGLRRGDSQGEWKYPDVTLLTVKQFIDAKLSPEQWEEIGREIKRPHNKLRELHLSDLTFKNDEFAMFCRCLSDVAEIVLSNLDLSRSQWGAIAKRLSSPDIKTCRLILTSTKEEKESMLALNALEGFKLLEKGKLTVFERY